MDKGALLFFVLVVFCLLSTFSNAAPTLQYVQILTRHGARTPFDDIPNHPLEWNCLVSPLSTPQVGDTTVVDNFGGRLYRKSYLTGRETLPGNCSAGQLTEEGLHQHYKLGQQFRKRYVDDLNFLSKDINLDEMFIRSADVERCVQSAQSQLSGLYPPQPKQPNVVNIVPIHTIEQALDDVETGARCQKLVSLCNDLQNTPEWKNYLAQFDSFQQYLIKSWNLTSNPALLPEWDEIFDVLESRVYKRLPFPPGINSTSFQQVVSIASGELYRIWNSTERVKLGAGQFLYEIYSRFSDFISRKEGKPLISLFGSYPKFPRFFPEKSDKIKYILYSAHDITCSLVLSGLGIFNGEWPQFASHIQMELYQDEGKWKVGVLYNGDKMYLPGCKNQWLCDWSIFESIMDKVVIKTKKEFDELCMVDKPVVPLNGISEYIC